MQPLVVVLLVILVIIIVLLVGRLVKTGGAFTDNGDYIEEASDNLGGPYTIVEVLEQIEKMLDAEVDLILDDCTHNGWDILRSKTYDHYEGMDTTIDQMKQIDSVKYAKVILLLQSFTYVNYNYSNLWHEWYTEIRHPLYILFYTYSRMNLITENEQKVADELYSVTPKRATPEVCNAIIKFIQDRDGSFNRAGTRFHDIIERIQAYMITIKLNKWTNILNYCINSSRGKRTKVAVQRTSSCEDDEAEYRL